MHEERFTQPPFVAPGADKPLSKGMSKQCAYDMMSNLKRWILADWPGAQLSIFENDQDCWVIRVEVASIDSTDGMLAYMNVFLRCNEQVHEYGLNKVSCVGAVAVWQGRVKVGRGGGGTSSTGRSQDACGRVMMPIAFMRPLP